jgi:PAS domain S-box-containing protein
MLTTNNNYPVHPTEAWLRALYEDAPVAIGFSRDGILLGANLSYLNLFGYEAGTSLVGKSVLDQIAPRARPDIASKVQLRAQNENLPSGYESTGIRTDGSEFPFQIQTRRVIVADGPLTLAFITETTEKARAETAREEAFELNRRLLSAAPMSVLAYSACGQCIIANEAAGKILGTTRERLLEQNFRDIRSWRDSGLLDVAELTLATGEPQSHISHLFTSFGTEVWLDTVCAPFEASGGRNLLFLARDVTQQRHAEEALRASEERLRHTQLLEGLGTLAGGIAHDFNNLLTGIMGNTLLALDDIGADSQAAAKLRVALESSRQAAELCRQMLTYSGKARRETAPLGLGDVVLGMADILQASVSKKAQLRFDAQAPAPLVVADASQLRQVVLNLVVNASEALGDRHGSIDVQVGTEWCDEAALHRMLPADPRPPGQYVFLRVRDTGEGMDAATRKRIFEPFYSTKFAGRGLGMATVLGIVRGHHGGIAVASTPGAGTTITVVLPASPQAAVVVAKPALQPLRYQGHGTVLLVDDDDAVRGVGARFLSRMGFTVQVAANGREALAVLATQGDVVRAVLLDLSMPVMDGEETLIEIRRMGLRMPIILCSGHGEHQLEAKATQLAISGHVAKPYDGERLGRALRAALEPAAE